MPDRIEILGEDVAQLHNRRCASYSASPRLTELNTRDIWRHRGFWETTFTASVLCCFEGGGLVSLYRRTHVKITSVARMLLVSFLVGCFLGHKVFDCSCRVSELF